MLGYIILYGKNRINFLEKYKLYVKDIQFIQTLMPHLVSDLCIVCKKNIIHNNYSDYYCGHFCSHLHYYRHRFGVSEQPITPTFRISNSLLEMRAREMAAKDEYKLMQHSSRTSEP